MKVVITINCENEAFNVADCGSELARILRQLANKLEFQPRANLTPPPGRRKRIRLVDHNGDTVGEAKFMR
jgi:hypothetical protein